MLNWIKDKWAKFEAWIYSWFPGFKTKTMLLLGTIGNGAAVFQSFVTGLPTTKYISTEVLSGVSMALYMLAFWFQGMGDRVVAAEPTAKAVE